MDGDHGRVKIRRYWTVSEIDWLYGKKNWKNLKIIGMVGSERHIDTEISVERRYYISSMENKAELFANTVRDHWGIENSIHCVLDVAFRQDKSQLRQEHAAENLAVLRHIALNLLRHEKTVKFGIEAKLKRGCWDNQYLMKVLAT